ncbi:DUF6456 domain-containing protein [Brevundimonas sp. Root1279]|uniref:DUF6456 domain-containing protein n=1 Tax=Brevundimonas sp. Root1279 TaxID=1736443 RepID=UPI0006F6CD32|nr:DUF6456 domain-containing protein [Brevundimonas sp. Root1279]KQW82357.1 hypothetical protein ASC65_08840 [Brevundimonas sp. Root1279]
MTVRVQRLLEQRDVWLDETPGGYALRRGGDRRTRVLTVIDEALFRTLVAQPGLRPRPGGGWTLRAGGAEGAPVPPPGPGVIAGDRLLVQPDGRITRHPANLAHSPVVWLAARKDADGRTFLDPSEVAAAERLAFDAETALKGPSLTMRWDALPRARRGSAAKAEPGDRALAAARRVEAALTACGPARAMIDHICIRATTLQAAEQGLGLRRREGKALLRQGLRALAEYYRIG